MDAPTQASLPPAGLTELVRQLLEENRPLNLRVTGASMAPFLRSGDVLTIRPHPRARFGDVVVRLEKGERLLIHRVIGRRRGELLTRGDAGVADDPPVAPGSLLGEVTRIERDGRRALLGLGPERLVVATLSRWGLLRPLMRGVRRLVFPLRRA